jgi:uncharacterized membrane protein YbhN (UPF0104 family)
MRVPYDKILRQRPSDQIMTAAGEKVSPRLTEGALLALQSVAAATGFVVDTDAGARRRRPEKRSD